MNMRLVNRDAGCCLCGADGSEPCSPHCVSNEWPPAPATPREWGVRLLAGIGLALAATTFVMPPGLPGLGLGLAALLACSFCGLLQVLTKVKVEPAGRVTSKGCCGHTR